jgi:hypothetical protein
VSLDLLTRSEWGASVPLGHAMKLPAAHSWIHHSVTRAWADMARCMREIEAITTRRFGRFAYSYCIHPDGTVGEGAGSTVGAHTARHNSTSYGICFLGNFETDHPTPEALDSCAVLLRMLRHSGELAPGTHPSGGHRDTKPTACPGNFLYVQIPVLQAAVAAEPVSTEDTVKLGYPDGGTVTLAPSPTFIEHVGEDTLLGVAVSGETYCMGRHRNQLAQEIEACGYWPAWRDGTPRYVVEVDWLQTYVRIRSDRGEHYDVPTPFAT